VQRARRTATWPPALADEQSPGALGRQRKLLELARLLMLDPDVLVLDEPFAGVHPVLKRSIADLVRRLREEGRAVLLIEHDLGTVFSLSERLVVLDAGRVVADGQPDRVKNDARVIAAYLGRGEPGRRTTLPGVGADRCLRCASCAPDTTVISTSSGV
jgi:branched-chain amino acid transport system ATP-binding protein